MQQVVCAFSRMKGEAGMEEKLDSGTRSCHPCCILKSVRTKGNNLKTFVPFNKTICSDIPIPHFYLQIHTFVIEMCPYFIKMLLRNRILFGLNCVCVSVCRDKRARERRRIKKRDGKKRERQ